MALRQTHRPTYHTAQCLIRHRPLLPWCVGWLHRHSPASTGIQNSTIPRAICKVFATVFAGARVDYFVDINNNHNQEKLGVVQVVIVWTARATHEISTLKHCVQVWTVLKESIAGCTSVQPCPPALPAGCPCAHHHDIHLHTNSPHA